MKLATFDGGRIGRVDGDRVVEVTGVPGGEGISAMRRLIRDWDRLGPQVVAAEGPSVLLADVTLEAPVPDPSKVVAAPINYRDHQSEMGQGSHVSALGFFLKAPSSIIGDGGVVQLPYRDRRFDQEGELACVIGRRARRVEPEQALDHVFGYTGAMDITMRGGEDRSTRKSFETFTPLGPWIVTADEFGPPDDVELRCTVTGTVRQEANTRDLIWSVAKLVSYASMVTTLEPGDVLLSGTPAGVDSLREGDTITLELSRLGGTLQVSVTSEGAVLSHTTGHDSGPKPPPASRAS